MVVMGDDLIVWAVRYPPTVMRCCAGASAVLALAVLMRVASHWTKRRRRGTSNN